jgi:hypothetical protein
VLVLIGLGTVFLAMVVLVLMDVYPRSPGNPGGRYRVTEGTWVFLQFAIGGALIYRLPGIGAGYVILTAIGAAGKNVTAKFYTRKRGKGSRSRKRRHPFSLSLVSSLAFVRDRTRDTFLLYKVSVASSMG